jgi:Ca2+-binding RTX toxin-like protein
MPRIDGTPDNDTLNGTEEADVIFGYAGDDVINGNGGDDSVEAGDGNDTINGGTGADLMVGQAGNETYYVDNIGDRAMENADSGDDTILTTIPFTMPANVERMFVLDPNSTYSINLTGNSAANELKGNNGSNYFEGGGGYDAMYGYGGNDAYSVDITSDVVREIANGGTDIIFTTANYDLTDFSGQYVERLAAFDPLSTNDIYLFGNELDNEITGNNGLNHIRGEGGVDTLRGMGGTDRYELSAGVDEFDIVIEYAGGGYDVVEVNFSYRLTDNVEELRGTHSASDPFFLTLTGNGMDNLIRGSDGMESIDGGPGGDSMLGGKGNDVYFVDNPNDGVAEFSNEGSDAIFTSISWVLSSSYSIEKLIAYGPGNLNLAGNSLANEISGNDGSNLLDGRLGRDTLIGYGGADTFAFTTVVDGANADLFLGFEAGVDKVALDSAVFAGLTPGALPADAFVVGSASADANDRILYDASTGNLFFDRDGTGPALAQYFASMSDGLALTASDFIVI